MGDINTDKLTQMVRARGRPFQVLIVEDEQRVREVFRDICELTQAMEVELAADGATAVEMVRSKRYDLITMDLIMPDMSGLDALVAIKQTAPEVPVMIITGNATEKLVHEAGVMGACRVMYKPIMMEQFVDEVTSALER
jgi:DNA-binding NtrC family response regulator